MFAKLVLLATMATPLSAQITSTQLAAHARAAQDAERRNNFPAAVHEYQIVAKSLPDNAEVQSNLGVALYFDHELPRAVAVFRRAIELNPALLAPHLFSGLAWYHLSNPDAAVPELEKAVHLNPSDVIARTWLGYAYAAQSRNEAAAQEFQAACRLDPGNIDVWYALGQAWLQIGKDASLKLLAIAPDGGRAWELAGEQYQLRGDRKAALADFEQAYARRPDIPELRALIARLGGAVAAGASQTAQHGGDSQEDILYQRAHDAEQKSHAAFERVIQLAPDSYRAHQIMADAYVIQQQDDKAIEEYRTVLKLKPDLQGIHEAIGEALIRSGKLPGALKEFEAELQMQPRSASANMDAGRVLLMMGKDDAAGKMLTAALQMDRPPVETYVLLGKLDVRHKDYKGAVNLLNHYTSTVKDNSTAYYLLAMAYRALGDKEQMKSSIALYRKTSEDAKERSMAQRELERLANGSRIGEETLRSAMDQANSKN